MLRYISLLHTSGETVNCASFVFNHEAEKIAACQTRRPVNTARNWNKTKIFKYKNRFAADITLNSFQQRILITVDLNCVRICQVNF